MYLQSSRKLQNSILLSIRSILKSFKDYLKYNVLPKKSIKIALHKKVCNPRKTKKGPPEGTFVKESFEMSQKVPPRLEKCHDWMKF